MPSNTEQDTDVILEIYQQRYQHVRHIQQMRATYFNLYIGVIGFSVTAIFGVYGSLNTIAPTVTIPLGGLIWVISVLSIMRAERWGGHITHDLYMIRKIHNLFSDKFKSVADLIPRNPKLLTSLEFDRPLWSRDRSIETPTMMIGAILSAFLIVLSLQSSIFAQAVTGALLVVFPILVWRGEVSHLIRRHAKCCLPSLQQRTRGK